ncbi:alkaline phosphatase family protein [Shewanella schlegeliana]|uniref:Alkaline phosphatase family protein n=1 Tax=Shewanella schlegeliana TaxID=190308 RepID=A0ABS1T291_9GAMM|nr:alkaline phosphatase family protein [Shewanella schlegeliana]MBL4914926.1 alkaline phosphatase family protein [Shewanella schlegeliana]MCL1110383.1 alkaline phosphatase family protein [Shewanella schlegeliana]GIU27906.1 metallophosphatase-binding domain protein [Shewanella schlegeliana]
MSSASSIPLIIAGPSLRHCDQQHFTLWFVCKQPLSTLRLALVGTEFDRELSCDEVHCIPLGEHAFQYLIRVNQDQLLPKDVALSYRLFDKEKGELFHQIDELHYPNEQACRFIIKPKIDKLMHGSCRNAHHHSSDALVAADTQLMQSSDITERPALLMMSGDQVYVDDIAGPMLYAIGQVIQLLGLHQEQFVDAPLADSSQISYQPAAMYRRHLHLLPKTQYKAKTAIKAWYINHPIFTSSLAENHLVSLNEVMALYLLYWSPELWDLIEIPKEVAGLNKALSQRWQKEWTELLAFKSGLKQVRRLMAHVPTYMIFDDHDITDDWNLTARWEQAAYGHAFSKRIIGNALIVYTIFQGLGNAPSRFDAEITPDLDAFLKSPTSVAQDALIDKLLSFEHWHYSLQTSPKLLVLDTRTRRWRSESNLAKPSGLMDWEALMEFQAELVNQPNVIIVSPAPIYGVKLIETVQRMATLCGGSLLVDAENWMAHPGTANTLLSIFQHRKTPEQFIILSGDVHYSFSYDVGIRFRHGGPQIYQITCSGFKNQFPEKLLPIFDKFNGWLYGHFSPLNFFTKRKHMSIRGRRPNGERSKRLVNQSGIGIVEIAADGAPTKIGVLHADMSETEFLPPRH